MLDEPRMIRFPEPALVLFNGVVKESFGEGAYCAMHFFLRLYHFVVCGFVGFLHQACSPQ